MQSVEESEHGRHDGRHGADDGVVSRASRWFWPAVVAGTYAAGVLVAAVAEYVSEMAKIGRGTFTDSFSPYLFTDLLTLPTSAVHPATVSYPAAFSASTFRELVGEAMIPTLANIAVQTLAVAAIVLACSFLRRSHGATA